MGIGFNLAENDRLEMRLAAIAAAKLRQTLRESERQARRAVLRQQLFGWPGILRTILYSLFGLMVLIFGGGHIIGAF